MPHFVICPRNQIIFEAIVLYDLMRLPDGSQILGMGLFTLAFLGIARSHPFEVGVRRGCIKRFAGSDFAQVRKNEILQSLRFPMTWACYDVHVFKARFFRNGKRDRLQPKVFKGGLIQMGVIALFPKMRAWKVPFPKFEIHGVNALSHIKQWLQRLFDFVDISRNGVLRSRWGQKCKSRNIFIFPKNLINSWFIKLNSSILISQNLGNSAITPLLAQMVRPELYDKRLLGATRYPRYSLEKTAIFIPNACASRAARPNR